MDSTSLFILPENFVGPLKIEEFGVNEYAEQFTSSHIHSRPDIFKKTALYVKQHPASGKLYFGKTLSKNVKQYKGSGRLWGKVISGCKQIDTLFVRWFENPADLVQYALSFSVINDIVCSSTWCNLIPEDGLNGGAIGCIHYKHK